MAVAYIAAQITGGCLGTITANLMFDLPAVTTSTHARSSGALWLGEIVATFGLLTVILGVVRAGRTALAPFAIASYIAAAYWFTSSTSFANPAVTIARTLTDTFAGIEPSSAPMFIVAEVVGAVLAIGARGVPLPAARRRQRRRAPRARRTSVTKPTVLFLCVHNAGRSQMALGWFHHLADENAIAYSGGSEPADALNPAVVQAMREVGIDITHNTPRRWTDADLDAADVVVTMGCGDTCPYVPGKRYEDWPLDDPAGQPIEQVRPIRDEIRRRVLQLLDTLTRPA